MFRTLVLSYAALLLIPGGLLIYVVNFSVLATIREQAIGENQKFVERSMRQAEQLFFELERIGVSIAQNRLLSRFELQKTPQNRLRAVNQLRNYRFVTGELYDILYYPVGGDRLYTSYGQGDARAFLSTRYRFPPDSIMSSIDGLAGVRNRSLAPEQIAVLEGGQVVTTLPYLWPLYEDAPHAVVVFLIDAGKIRETLTDGSPDHTARITVTNAAGEPIASWGNDDGAPARTARLLPRRPAPPLVHRAYSDSMRLTFSSTIGEDALLGAVREIERHLMLTLAAIFVTGTLIILVGLRSNYRPIARLVRNVSDAFRIDSEGMDEVTLVRSALTTTADSNRRLQTRVEALKPLLRDYVLRELVESSRPLIDDPNQVSIVLGPEDGYESVHTIVVGHTPEGTRSLEEELAALEADEPGLTISPIPNESDDLIILLVSVAQEQRSRLRELVGRIDASITSACSDSEAPCGVRAGSVFTDILAAGQSYAEAMAALYRTTADHGPVENGAAEATAGERPDPETGHAPWFPDSAADRLRRHLEAADLASIRTTLSRMHEDLTASGSPQFLSRCMLYDLFNTVLRVASQRRLDLESVLGPDTYLFLSRSHQTIDALFEALGRACENLASHVRTDSPLATQTVTDALEIIRIRHTDASFGVETLAADLGVSVPHLSRTFKKAQGETISEHVWRLRFERAKTMLEESHAPINEIAVAVGYADISAFIRRFRRQEGVSPGKYRRQL